jgi:Domain of unknown function (DUF5615)
MATPSHRAPKLHLNEHLSPRLAQQLRRHGFDVTSTQESELLSKSDRDQLEYCCMQKRAILTFNIDDFTLLHEEFIAAEKEHWGIILSTREPIGVLLRRLLRLLNSLTADELKNQIQWLNEFK